MSRILVSGLINLETTLQIDDFPVSYTPVQYPFFGIRSSISGVGYNVAKALATLGDSVDLLSLIGKDPAGRLIYQVLEEEQLPAKLVLNRLDQTAQSVIIYDQGGRRQIHVDLKDIQDNTYPSELFKQALAGCRLAVLCNINFSRPFLQIARLAGIPIATDVHAVSSLDDPYNQEFMANADILFMSHEHLSMRVEEWVVRVFDKFPITLLVIGMGAEGALLGVREPRFIARIPAVHTRPVVNTIGAGDALFSSFVHSYLNTGDAYDSIRKALVFASYKIGETGAADGFLDPNSLDRLAAKIWEEYNQDQV